MRSFHIILFLRRGAQTLHPEKPPAAVGVCAPLPGKPYSSVERRKPFTGKSARSQCEFAPPSRESLITPLRGANRLPGKGAAAVGVCASFPGKPYFSVEKRKPFTRKSAGGRGSLRPIPGKACYEVTVVKRRLQESFFSRHGTFVFS